MYLSIKKNYRWVGYALLCAASTALMATCVRLASMELPRIEVVFFRNFMGLLVLLPLVIRRKLSLRTQKPGLHLLRAIFGFITMYLYFFALNYLPLADAVLLHYTSPLFVAFFASLLLGEQLGISRKISLSFGFLGVCCLFHPSSAIASLAGLLGILSGVSAGLAQTCLKKLSATESSLLIVTWFALFGTIVSLVPMLLEFIAPSLLGWILLLGIGLFGSIAQLALTRAYSLAPASQVSPLGYFALVFAGIIGFVFWGETPDIWMLLGTVLIVTAGLLVTREEVVS